MQKTAYEEQKATFEDSWVSLIACKKVIIIEKSGQTGNENLSSSHKPRVHISLEFTEKDNCFSKKKIYIMPLSFFFNAECEGQS